MYWMMGGFGGVDWRQSWLMLALIPVLLWDLLSVQADEYVSTSARSRRGNWVYPCGSGAMCWVAATGWMVGVSVALAGAIGSLVW